MTDVPLRYLNSVKAKGRLYWYYRRHGMRQRIEGKLGTPEFLENYRRIHAAFDAESRIGVAAETFASLIAAYLSSPEFGDLAPETKYKYRHHLDKMRERFGHLSYRTMSRTYVIAWRWWPTMGRAPPRSDWRRRP